MFSKHQINEMNKAASDMHKHLEKLIHVSVEVMKNIPKEHEAVAANAMAQINQLMNNAKNGDLSSIDKIRKDVDEQISQLNKNK